MYCDVKYCIDTRAGYTTPFTSNLGVKQGCVLSPLLFNMYTSDLPDIFDVSCDAIDLYDVKLNCLMYADDLILLSESASGLQCCLNKLQEYCSRWKLTVNIDKTNIMIFNKGGKKIKAPPFLYNGNKILVAQRYCYLGI